MIKIGDFNDLRVHSITPEGITLATAEQYTLRLWPFHECELSLNEMVRAFVYTNAQGENIATLKKPLAQVGDIARLQVLSVSQFGAFLNWGLPKDILVPYSEQDLPMQQGKRYLVKIYYDRANGRIVASSKLGRFIKNHTITVKEGERVQLQVAEFNDNGIRVIINQQHWGLLYYNEVFTRVHIGQQLSGYVKKVREDDKIDVSLQAQGYSAAIDAQVQQLLQALKNNNNFLPITDKSSPEIIYMQLQMSKKAFKKALGALYKQRMVRLENNGISLLATQNK